MSEIIEPPVKEGDILKLGVVRFGKKDNSPIMVHERFIIFLKDMGKRGVTLNEMIEIRITKVLPTCAFAERTNGK